MKTKRPDWWTIIVVPANIILSIAVLIVCSVYFALRLFG